MKELNQNLNYFFVAVAGKVQLDFYLDKIKLLIFLAY